MTAAEEWAAMRLQTLVIDSNKLYDVAKDLAKQLVDHHELTNLLPSKQHYFQKKMVTPLIHPPPASTSTEEAFKEYKCGLHAVIFHILKKYNLVTKKCIDDLDSHLFGL
jgi:triphosphoribosyl-dephospho-CoA synthetase